MMAFVKQAQVSCAGSEPVLRIISGDYIVALERGASGVCWKLANQREAKLTLRTGFSRDLQSAIAAAMAAARYLTMHKRELDE